jgi:hypothetical protein
MKKKPSPKAIVYQGNANLLFQSKNDQKKIMTILQKNISEAQGADVFMSINRVKKFTLINHIAIKKKIASDNCYNLRTLPRRLSPNANRKFPVERRLSGKAFAQHAIALDV